MASKTLQQDYLDTKALYEDAVDVTQTDTKTVVVLNFKALQLLRIKTLQQELFDFQMQISLGSIGPEERASKLQHLDTTLQAYGRCAAAPIVGSSSPPPDDIIN